jgi:hypothetical protein
MRMHDARFESALGISQGENSKCVGGAPADKDSVKFSETIARVPGEHFPEVRAVWHVSEAHAPASWRGMPLKHTHPPPRVCSHTCSHTYIRRHDMFLHPSHSQIDCFDEIN